MVQRYLQAAILSGIFLLAAPAAAMAQFYAGLDGDRYSVTLKSSASQLYPQSLAGENLYAGYRWHNFTAEAGYGTSNYASTGTSDNMHLTRATLDGYLYVPIFEGLNLVFTAGGVENNYGISTYQITYTLEDGTNHKHNEDQTVLNGDEFDWRAGGGFSFGFDAFELRLLGRYQPLSMGGVAENAVSINLGLNVYLSRL